MSKSEPKVAKRYAKALFESCNSQNFDEVSTALQEISVALSEPSVRSALLNPSFTTELRNSWLSELIANACPSEAKSLSNLFSAVVENRRVDSVPALAEYFAQLVASYKKLLALEVTSAKELSSIEKETFSGKVKASLSAEVAAGVSFNWKTQADLLGGMQVRVGDKLLDGSIAGAINKIARQLRS